MGMIKILFFINTLEGGGAEKVLHDLANNLDSAKYEITIKTLFNTGIYQKSLNPNIKYEYVYKKENKIMRFLRSKLLSKFYSPEKFYKKYFKSDYDIEIAFLEGLTTKVIAASTNRHSKKIAWVHTDLMKYFNSVSAYKSIEENKKCYQKFDKIACVSENVKENFIARFGCMKEVETVYNIILDDEIRKKSAESLTDIKKDFPIIVSCGRLCEQKGFDRLLHVHKKLLAENIKHYLWIIGEGKLRSQFETYIEENNLSNTVTLWGFQSNPYKYIKNADLFVCSSTAEGYSTVVTEATVLGVPILSTDVAGADEPKECPRCDVVVENSEQALYDGIKATLQDDISFKMYKENAYKKQLYFSKEKTLSEIISFING